MHGLTHRKFNTVFDNFYLSQLLCTKETIRLNEDYWGQNLWEKEWVSKNFFLTTSVLSARRDMIFLGHFSHLPLLPVKLLSVLCDGIVSYEW